jgi:hypothetical protein
VAIHRRQARQLRSRELHGDKPVAASPTVVCRYGDERPDIPAETRCEACGRVIPLHHVTIGYDMNMKPDDLD